MDAPTNPPGTNHNPVRNATQAAVYLESLIRTKPSTSGQRARVPQRAVRELLARMGNPQSPIPTIHIAGSKGKGSTALLTESILLAAGRRTGTFTSPHLQRWPERYRVAGRPVSDEQFTAAVETLRPHVNALLIQHPENPPSFFDVATAVAFLLFQRTDVEFAIVEAGLGGRLDATTVVIPRVTCITSIEFEHTDKLGTSLEAIAREKAGIIKPGVPVVIGGLPPVALSQVRQRAKTLGAPVVHLHDELRLRYDARGVDGFVLSLALGTLAIDAVSLPLLGEQAVHNAALAAACVFLLNTLDGSDLVRALKRGYTNIQLPGRIEVLSRHPWVVVDAAHTEASSRALAAVLERLPAQPAQLILSISRGKRVEAITKSLLPGFGSVIATTAEPTRSQPAHELAAMIRACHADAVVRVIADPRLAVRQAFKILAPDDLLCITGSVYMAGIARATLMQTQ